MGHFPFCPVPSSLLFGPAFPIDFVPSSSLSSFCRLHGCDGKGEAGSRVPGASVRLTTGRCMATAGWATSAAG